MKFLKLLALGALATGLMAGTALAGTYTTATVSFTNQVTDLGRGGTPAQVLTIAAYDGRGGALTSVAVFFDISEASSGTVTNTASQAQTFTANNDSTVAVSTAQLTGTQLTLFKAELGNQLFADQQYTLLAPNTPTPFGPFNIDSTVVNGGTSLEYDAGTQTALNAFLTPFSFSVSTNTVTGSSGAGGNANVQVSTTASASAYAVYTYADPVIPGVPEPASMAILGAGLFGVGLLRRSRK